MVAITFYTVVVSLHVMAIVIAFGVTFAYPVLVPFVLRRHPTAMPALHAAQDLVGKRVIAPFGGLALLAGIYLASDRDLWGETWVIVPLVILVALLASGGLFFSPTASRLSELATRDVAAATAGQVQWSAEYQALGQRMAIVGSTASLLVLVAIFFMVARPFA